MAWVKIIEEKEKIKVAFIVDKEKHPLTHDFLSKLEMGAAPKEIRNIVELALKNGYTRSAAFDQKANQQETKVSNYTNKFVPSFNPEPGMNESPRTEMQHDASMLKRNSNEQTVNLKSREEVRNTTLLNEKRSMNTHDNSSIMEIDKNF